MNTRREFFRRAAMLSGGAGVVGSLLSSVQKASAIDPPAGSTYLDAEHVVILMQENRSFDHSFGTLRGVRGFNDPRAVTLPDGNPVWLQTNKASQTYAPFRLNIKETKSTWLGGLPHSWSDQNDARNHGNHDNWLDSKPAGSKEIAGMPMTMGHYQREDLPFYYALADAFTICDQHFCSSLTGTTPNRLYLWTGTIRDEQRPDSRAKVRNSDVDYGRWANWTTFPERLEDNGVSWKIYQNEINIDSGFEGEADAWLSNFSDNPIEWFTQYHVGFAPVYRRYLEQILPKLPGQIEELKKKIETVDATPEALHHLREELHSKEQLLKHGPSDLEKYSRENFEQLPERERNLHTKAFTNNAKDPHYRELEPLQYMDGATKREFQIPKGDVLHQFREDVKNGQLPTVSWMVAPENFSDHPGAPWFGEWYLAETIDILTQNPEVWKKTIFILTYDENDGYFDHVPPFTAPHPDKPETGRTSPGIDAAIEYHTLEQDRAHEPEHDARGGSIGLGFRVPMVIASPWSRGGAVCSQVFDHTSVLQFLEKFTSHKSGKEIRETNITAWRRTVCGDLTSAFTPYYGEKAPALPYPAKDEFLEGVHKAKFKKLPGGYKQLSSQEIAQFKKDPSASSLMSRQEKGVRPACPLPYQLYAEGKLNADKKALEITFEAKSAGSPFHVYTPGKHFRGSELLRTRAYAVAAGGTLNDTWELEGFENAHYHLRACGPNGFLREFAGNGDDPLIEIRCGYAPNGNVELHVMNHGDKAHTLHIRDHAYRNGDRTKTVAAGAKASVILNLGRSHGWYDFSVKIAGAEKYERRYAGHVETDKFSISDPAMGRVIV